MAIKTKTNKRIVLFIILILAFSSINISALAQSSSYRLYPETYGSMPDISSPFTKPDNTETVTVITKDRKYCIVPVTVENGDPLLYSYKRGSVLGKDKQLRVDVGDFPELAKKGLHSEDQLNKKEMITGIPIHIINCTGMPNAYSAAGFMAADEDIISVLIGDNRLVKAMGLKHYQLAKPLFHMWNIILKETELGNWKRHYDNIKSVYYNNHLLKFKASGSKGWQISIFNDEVQGMYDIHISRELSETEENYLTEKYTHLTDDEMTVLKDKLTQLHFSEMLPFYIMRYGFYEGHTDYRCDPIAIALIFGLKDLKELDQIFNGDLYNILLSLYTSR